MAKSSVAVRTSSRTAARSTATASIPATSRRKTALTTIPTPHNTPMTDAELEVIWKTYKHTRDENLPNTLIEHHMPLVRSLAEGALRTLRESIDVDDLRSAGTCGLMDAINGFDLARGIKFKTDCTTRIRG